MNGLADLNAASPPELFVKLWILAEKWDEALRSRELPVPASFEESAREALQLDSSQSACNQLLGLLAPYEKGAVKEWMSACFWAMRAIDDSFYAIHPRHAVFPGVILSVPNWLLEYRDGRRKDGYYLACRDRRLIARGPLLRRDRDERAGSADSLADRFAALSVVNPIFRPQKTPVKIKVVNGSRRLGVASPAAPGEETILFAAIAEVSGDINPAVRAVGKRGYVDYQVVNPPLFADRMIGALTDFKDGVDIAIAPELVSTEEAIHKMQESLKKGETVRPRIVVAGSGLTRSRDGNIDAPWNETSVLNSHGLVIWRQQKLSPSELDEKGAKNYGVHTVAGADVYHEDTASGSEFWVADLDSFGRCIVLICQDIQTDDISRPIIKDYQPDWIFTPILDPGVRDGCWVHQRAFELSKLSQARFLISSSTWLAKGSGSGVIPCFGLAVGPCSPTRSPVSPSSGAGVGDKGRAVAFAPQIAGGGKPAYAVLRWRTTDAVWTVTRLGAV